MNNTGHKLLQAILWLCMLSGQSLHAALMAEQLLTINADLKQPTDTAVSDNGDIYVLNGAHSQVVVFTAQGRLKNRFAGEGVGDGKLRLPMGLSIRGQRVYIADTGNARIAVFDLDGKFVRNILLDDRSSKQGRVAPVSLLLSEKNIIWSDRKNHQLCTTNIADGKTLHCQGKKGEADGEFRYPYQLVADEHDYIFAVDVLNARVQLFSPKGRHVMNVGRFGVQVKGGLFRPNGLALNAQDYLLVSDAYLGTISVFKGGMDLGALRAADASILTFASPTSLTLHKNRLYVTDTASNRVAVFKLINTSQVADSKNTGREMPLAGTRKNCVSCHISWADNFVLRDDNVPVAPVAHQRMCDSCHHGVVIDSRQAIGEKYQHPDVHHRHDDKNAGTEESGDKETDKIASEFPVIGRAGEKVKELYCGSCHTPHKFENGQDKDSDAAAENNNHWMRESNTKGEVCVQCHESKRDNVQHKKRKAVGVNHAVGYFLKPGDANKFYAKDKSLHKGLPQKMLSAGARLNARQQMVCQSCHKVHGSDEEKLTVIKTDNAQMCVQCHQRHDAKDLKDARKKGVHPVNIKLDEPVKINGKKIEKVDCLSCHSAHDGKPGSALLNLEDKNGELCNACHKDYDRVVNTAHDLRLSAKKSKNNYQQTPAQVGVCGSCHRMHQAQENKFSLDATVTEPYQGKEKPLPRDQACLNCHRKDGIADRVQIKYFSHPVKDLILRSDKKNMPLLDAENAINEFGEIACVTCHNPHRWSAHKNIEAQAIKKGWQEKNAGGNVHSSFLRQKEIQGSFCQDCHGIESKIKYKYYHLPSSRRESAD